MYSSESVDRCAACRRANCPAPQRARIDLDAAYHWVFASLGLTAPQPTPPRCAADADELERLSHLLGTYRALSMIFADRAVVRDWLLSATGSEDRRSALDVLCQGDLGQSRALRQWVEAHVAVC